MTLQSLYVLARNGHDRPVCQHKLVEGTASLTACGEDMQPWSRQYTHTRFDVLLCKRPACRS
jgi:hypothetical protein